MVKVGDAWAIRTAPDLGFLMQKETVETRKLSRAAIETLAIIAYHQPVTRAEIEEIRGVSVSRGTVDQLIEMEWIRFGRRRMTPGRPVTFVVTSGFLDHFGLESARDLPGLKELRAAGLWRPTARPPDADDDGEDGRRSGGHRGQSELFEDQVTEVCVADLGLWMSGKQNLVMPEPDHKHGHSLSDPVRDRCMNRGRGSQGRGGARSCRVCGRRTRRKRRKMTAAITRGSRQFNEARAAALMTIRRKMGV